MQASAVWAGLLPGPFFSLCWAGNLLPGHERGVDHVRHALAADRADGEVHVLQPEAVGGDFLQRKTLRGELSEGELAGLVAVAARALDGDEFHRDPFEREVRELLHLALHHDRPAFALQGLYAEQDREGPGARGAVERDVHAAAPGDLLDARERILLLHVDHVIGAQFFRDLHPRGVLGGARDDDERGARLLADDDLRQPLLTGPLDEHAGVVADAAVEERPFDAVRHGGDQSRQFRRDALRYLVHDGIPREVYVLRKSAPQVRRLFGGGVAVADAVGVGAPVGVFAVAVLAEVAPLALAAHDVVLDEDEVAFLDAFAPGELAARLGDRADVLVAHDHGGIGRRRLVQLHVRPADSGDLHLHERAVLRDIRHGKFADLGSPRARSYSCQNFFHLRPSES